ncbi:unnamed protein product [Dibothriocephalus latus]|uniref:Uncharacterized protein n=1 Tax=Dibothriocephalus latus TaxID=60516 RepID=A0A3P6QL59_DIBLA|nr:unnamed protein product [Dibothriocephalus latus]
MAPVLQFEQMHSAASVPLCIAFTNLNFTKIANHFQEGNLSQILDRYLSKLIVFVVDQHGEYYFSIVIIFYFLQFRTDVRPKFFRTLALLCEDESLSDAQLKAYQTRLQEYQTFLEAVSRLANCGNVCITEEAVMIGENGLLTGESLNALQHAGAISVYNTLQQNNWEFPVPEEGEAVVIKTHTTMPDEFLDQEKPIRSDWPSIHISECFVEGEKAKLHGSVRPLRTFLPPSIVFRNAADIDDDMPEPEIPVSNSTGIEAGLEIVSTSEGLAVRKPTEKDTEPGN